MSGTASDQHPGALLASVCRGGPETIASTQVAGKASGSGAGNDQVALHTANRRDVELVMSRAVCVRRREQDARLSSQSLQGHSGGASRATQPGGLSRTRWNGALRERLRGTDFLVSGVSSA